MSSVIVAGNTSGSITLQAPDVAGTTVLNLPATSGTIITTGGGSAGSFTSISDSSLTSGRITYATTGGLLADSANMTFDGTSLGLGGGNYDTGTAIDGNSKFGRTDRAYMQINRVGSASGSFINFFTTPNASGGLVERMRIDSDGNLGVGFTSLYSPSKFQVQVSTGQGIFYRSGTFGSSEITFATSGLATYSVGTIGASTLKFNIVGTQAMTLDSSGNLLVGITSAVSGGANLQVSDGITFPATAVASANANTLDDYEEGSFTPTISGSTTAGTGTYTTQVGTYTKVGRLVTVTGVITWTAHTGTGGMRVSGLPFTSINTANAEYYGTTAFVNMTMPASTVPLMAMGANTASITVQSQTVGSGASTLLTMDTAASIYFSLTYQAA